MAGYRESYIPQSVGTHESDAFVNSIGVNIHLHYNGSFYRENFPLLKQRLVELGVRHYRDILVDTAWTPYFDRHNELGRAGLKGIFAVSAPGVTDDVLRQFPARVAQSFSAYEAVNEYDRSGNAEWVPALRDALMRLRAVSASFPVIGPAMAFSDKLSELGDVSGHFDLGNLHMYFGARHPGSSGWGVTDSTFASYEYHFRYAQQFCGGKPIVATETGYFDAPTSTVDVVPEAVSAKYMPRLLLEQYRQGIRRSYVYEMADEPGQRSYGLLRVDGTPKPAFLAVKGLLQLLSDPGPRVALMPLAYTLGAGVDVRSLLFQKRDGCSYLAIWVEQPCYDPVKKVPLTVAPQSVTVAFKSPTRVIGLHRWQENGSVVHDPWGNSVKATEVVLWATDALQVLEWQVHS